MKQKHSRRPKEKHLQIKPPIKKINSLQWVFDGLEERPDYIEKKMFGCLACYLDDRMVLVLADSEDPWNGLLIPTDRKFHSSILAEFKNLISHPVLGKWLYLSQHSSDFEEISLKIVNYINAGDPRFGVEPKPKKRNNKRSQVT